MGGLHGKCHRRRGTLRKTTFLSRLLFYVKIQAPAYNQSGSVSHHWRNVRRALNTSTVGVLDCGRNGSDGRMGGWVTWPKPSLAERWLVSWGPGGQAESWSEFNWMTPMRPIRVLWAEILLRRELCHQQLGCRGNGLLPQIHFHSSSHSLILIVLKHPER